MKRTFLLILALIVAPLGNGQTVPAGSGLRLEPGDLITCEVFDVPELKQEIRIGDRGDADLALLGKLHLSDLTIDEAQAAIAAELETHRLVMHPQVSIFVKEYATQGVAVAGEVRKPGVYPVFGRPTLTQVLSEAGGTTETSAPPYLVRKRTGIESAVNAEAANATLIEPGDTVSVPRAGIAYIVGDVARSGGYVMRDRGSLSIAQLVAMGGGLLPTAKATKARLIRKTPSGERQEIDINVKEVLHGRALDLQMQPDDILFIPNSLWRSAANRIQNITQMTAGAAIYTSLN